MDKLTFDSVMNFYPKHNQSVYNQILASQKNGSLLPFVGAGLSVFCGYKLWGGVLWELAEFIPTLDEQECAFTQIQNYEYEKAAQTILDAYPPMLDQLPTIVSADKLQTCSPDSYRTSAAYVLPYLFPKGLVITTNFDRVLETVYQRCLNNPIQVVTPKEQDKLAQLRQNQALGLFKLHGDIGSDTVSIDDLVFTGEQYQQKYLDDSPLVQELIRWFENRRLLFLGCSLNVDRTMDVLKKVALSQTGIRHFAILGCDKKDIPERLRELSSLGILPIFYDNSNHDAIRIILERLLEDTNSSSYAQLRKESWIAPAVSKEERRLLFDADYFEFAGRENELQQLEAFCTAEEQVLWWSVTGPGGMGKSRLVYEFSKQKQQEGWTITRFEACPSRDSSAQCLDQIEAWTPDSNRAIVILDDVQAYIESVCRWLGKMYRNMRSEKLRILLLEREGKDLLSATWLDVDSSNNSLGEWVYNKQFLHLKPMDDQSIMTIMDNYAQAAGKSLNAQLLIKTLEKVDPNLKRPLYAIAIADARCQGKDPSNWDRIEILDTLLKRELKFHFDRLIGISTQKIKLSKTLQTEIELLFAHACVQEPLALNEFPVEQYKTLCKLMDNFNMAPDEFFERLGVIRDVTVQTITVDQYGNPIGPPSNERRETIISLSCPDLIKEHLVLNLALNKGKIELLFPDGWQNNPSQILLLRKLIADHHDRLKKSSSFCESILNASPEEDLPTWMYCDILWGYTVVFPDWSNRALERLQQVHKDNVDDIQIAVFYSNALTNLTYEHDPEKRIQLVDELETLYHRYPESPRLANNYATGICNLWVNDNVSLQTTALDRMEELYQEQLSNADIALYLAKMITSMSVDQEIPIQVKAVERIEELCKAHSYPPNLVAQFMLSMAVSLQNREAQDQLNTLARLENLFALHSQYEIVQEAFAGALLTVSLIQETESEVRKTLSRSLDFLNQHPNNLDMQLSYAQTLFNLSLVQQEADIAITVSDICSFLQSHTEIIPFFKKALAEYLSKNPEHTTRYLPLQKL